VCYLLRKSTAIFGLKKRYSSVQETIEVMPWVKTTDKALVQKKSKKRTSNSGMHDAVSISKL
jgi:hypothetical protein